MTVWAELPRPRNFAEAVAVASRIVAARLDADPRARWRLRIDRAEHGPPRVLLLADREGGTRADFFARLAVDPGALSTADLAMLHRLRREELLREARSGSGRGRPKRTESKADLARPAGQSLDVLVYETCAMLKALGWGPMSRAGEGTPESVFDAVALAMRACGTPPTSYSGVRAAYYRVLNN